MKERKKLKEIYSTLHENAILVILAIAIFIGGYLFSWNFIEKPLNDSQIEYKSQYPNYQKRENNFYQFRE